MPTKGGISCSPRSRQGDSPLSSERQPKRNTCSAVERANSLGAGTYVLSLSLQTGCCIQIGKLGTFHFPTGYYCYVGSAFGPGGLEGRLRHHLRPSQRPHWHLDYLKRCTEPESIWIVPDGVKHEHTWAKALSTMAGASVPASKFGASDCKCPSHLYHFQREPSLSRFKAVLRESGHRIDVEPHDPVEFRRSCC